MVEILYYDVTSEYLFVNSRKEYPVGYPKIFLKHQVPQTNEEWQRRGFFGVALYSIVPPKKLLQPLLPFCHQGTLMFLLSNKRCVEKHKDFCQHDDKEWVLTGTWTTIEKLTRLSCWVTNYLK